MSDATPAAVDGEHESREDARTSVASRVRQTPGRTRLLLLVVALAAVAVALAAVGLRAARQPQSPEYSLDQMTNAVRSGDWDGVQTYLDVDAVAGSFVDFTLANALEGDSPGSMGSGSGGSMGGGGNTPGSSGSGIADRMKDAFIRQFSESLKVVVEARGKTSTGEPVALLALKKPATVQYLSDTEVLATVRMQVDADQTKDVSVRMLWVDDHWRITSLEGTYDLAGLLE